MRIYPAIRAQMGDWKYYIVRMKMREIAQEVKLAQDIYKDMTLSDAIQRTLGEKRVKTDIVGYLARRSDRFFSSIVVAAMEGEPAWHPVEMDESVVPKIFATSNSLRDSFGVLSFGDEPRYYALDGQHRVAAIKHLVNKTADIEPPEGFDDDLLSVIVVLREEHDVEEGEWMRRYRRLFSSLNRYAKPTDRDTNIIMDEDDLFAIVTRRLITEHEFFQAPGPERQSFKVLTKGKNLRVGASHFTTLQTLYEVNKKLLETRERQVRGWYPDQRKLNIQARPDEEDLDRFYDELVNYWDAILTALPVLREPPGRMRNHDVEDLKDGRAADHLLFWPIGQELFGDLVRDMLNGAFPEHGCGEVERMAKELSRLVRMPWELHDVPWRYLLLVPTTDDELSWRMRNEDRKDAVSVAYRILCWLVGRETLNEEETLELRDEWQKWLIRPTRGGRTIDDMWNELVAMRRGILTE